MTRVLISLGSNIEPERNLPEAVRLLAKQCELLAVSHVFQTRPVGKTDQPDFLNAAALVETELSPDELKNRVLREIEQELGRVRSTDKNAPRTIDLDITLYGDAVLSVGSRRIPDPELLRYEHIAVPAADAAPDMPHPETRETLAQVASRLATGTLRPRSDVVLPAATP